MAQNRKKTGFFTAYSMKLRKITLLKMLLLDQFLLRTVCTAESSHYGRNIKIEFLNKFFF